MPFFAAWMRGVRPLLSLASKLAPAFISCMVTSLYTQTTEMGLGHVQVRVGQQTESTSQVIPTRWDKKNTRNKFHPPVMGVKDVDWPETATNSNGQYQTGKIWR